jgi:hypothetical protein
VPLSPPVHIPCCSRGIQHLLATPPSSPAALAGARALWKGLVPRLARTPPGQAIVWAVSDQITGYFEKQRVTEPAGAR